MTTFNVVFGNANFYAEFFSDEPLTDKKLKLTEGFFNVSKEKALFKNLIELPIVPSIPKLKNSTVKIYFHLPRFLFLLTLLLLRPSDGKIRELYPWHVGTMCIFFPSNFRHAIHNNLPRHSTVQAPLGYTMEE